MFITSPLCMVIAIAFTHPVFAITWQTTTDAYWALNCDFAGNDIGSRQVPGHLCSGTCAAVSGCTHFAWTTYNSGTCWMKRKSGVSRSEAINNPAPASVCGILRGSTSSPPRPAGPISSSGGHSRPSSSTISWHSSSDAFWATRCDFAGKDISSARVTPDRCSSICGRTAGCTHFAFTLYNGGTCWMKTGSVRKESDAVRSTKAGAMCGVMKHKSPVNVPPPRQPSWHALQYAADYLPIFRYDQESGSFCFPDDKRLISSRDNKCNGFNRRAPVFISYKQCGSHHVYQYNLWYGLQKGCGLHGLTGGRHGDDNEYVQVWVRTSDRSVDKVRYNQHNGYYFRSVGGGAEMNGKRVVVYIGKIAHGAYHRGCTGNPFRGGTRKCLGINWALALTFTNCAYWEDYRNPKGKYDLDQGQLIDDPSPREIDCNPGVCRPGHSYSRAVKDSSCYGVNN